MKLFSALIAILFAAALVAPNLAFAGDDDGEVDEREETGDESIPCKTIGAFLVGAGAYLLTARVGLSVLAGYNAADATPSSSSTMSVCTSYVRRYIDYIERRGNIDYEEFLREWCNNNPANCPNNLAVQQLATVYDPRLCHSYISCALDLLAAFKPHGASVNDLVNAMHFVSYSVSYGYWAGDDYGFLLGLPPNQHEGSGGSFDIY